MWAEGGGVSRTDKPGSKECSRGPGRRREDEHRGKSTECEGMSGRKDQASGQMVGEACALASSPVSVVRGS